MTESLHPGGLGAEGNPGLNPNDSTPCCNKLYVDWRSWMDAAGVFG